MGEDIKISNFKIARLGEKEAIYMPLERKNLGQIPKTKVHFNLPKIEIEIKLWRKEIKKIKRMLGMDKKYLKYLKRVRNRRKLHGK